MMLGKFGHDIGRGNADDDANDGAPTAHGDVVGIRGVWLNGR